MTIEERAEQILAAELATAPKAFWNRTPERRAAKLASVIEDLRRQDADNAVEAARKSIYQALNTRWALKKYVNGRVYINRAKMAQLLRENGIDAQYNCVQGFWIDESGCFDSIDAGGKDLNNANYNFTSRLLRAMAA